MLARWTKDLSCIELLLRVSQAFSRVTVTHFESVVIAHDRLDFPQRFGCCCCVTKWRRGSHRHVVWLRVQENWFRESAAKVYLTVTGVYYSRQVGSVASVGGSAKGSGGDWVDGK